MIETFMPHIPDLPCVWKLVQERADGKAFLDKYQNILVIISGEKHDGKEWTHISFSRRSRMPSYEDMVRVKRDFLGDDKKAIMVLPDKDHHVNIHPYCLHLFYSEDCGLPEFSYNGSL